MLGDGTLNANDIAVLLPGMALVGSTVQYMGRVLGVLEVPGRHYLVLFGICILNAYFSDVCDELARIRIKDER